MKPFDNYEISPCRRYVEAGLPDPNGTSYEVCDPDEADVWTLYGHIPGEGVQALGDFATREDAEEVFFRITGIEFTGSHKADAHLRIMQAGPKLLEALRTASEWIDAQHFVRRTDIQETIRKAIAEATGQGNTTVDHDIDAILQDRRQIAVIWSTEDVQEVRPDLTPEQCWEVLQATESHLDANIGINWDVLNCHADMLFGPAAKDSDPEGEG